MRWGIGALVALAMIAAGCRNETGGPSVSAYEAAKPTVLAKAKERTAPQPAPEAQPKPAAEPAPEPGAGQARTTTGYRYDPTDKRDPFRSFVLDEALEASEDEAGPLEQFDVSQLSVIAVVWELGKPRALLADPSGRPYIVTRGTPVGKNDGRVIGIDDNLVLVKETYVDWLGDKTTKDIEMRLHGGDKGGDLR